jgi:hypothetical protein
MENGYHVPGIIYTIIDSSYDAIIQEFVINCHQQSVYETFRTLHDIVYKTE